MSDHLRVESGIYFSADHDYVKILGDDDDDIIIEVESGPDDDDDDDSNDINNDDDDDGSEEEISINDVILMDADWSDSKEDDEDESKEYDSVEEEELIWRKYVDRDSYSADGEIATNIGGDWPRPLSIQQRSAHAQLQSIVNNKDRDRQSKLLRSLLDGPPPLTPLHRITGGAAVKDGGSSSTSSSRNNSSRAKSILQKRNQPRGRPKIIRRDEDDDEEEEETKNETICRLKRELLLSRRNPGKRDKHVQNRSQHNSAEKIRRAEMRVLFESLHDSVLSVTSNVDHLSHGHNLFSKAKVSVLHNATRAIKFLKTLGEQLESTRQCLEEDNIELALKLHSLRNTKKLEQEDDEIEEVEVAKKKIMGGKKGGGRGRGRAKRGRKRMRW